MLSLLIFVGDPLVFISAGTGRLFEVERKQAVSMRNASLMDLSVKGM